MTISYEVSYQGKDRKKQTEVFKHPCTAERFAMYKQRHNGGEASIKEVVVWVTY